MIKIKKVMLWIVACLPLLATILMLAYLPDKIPAHYNFAGEVDRYGSKFELLILPILTIVFVATMEIIIGILGKKKSSILQNSTVYFIVEITLAVVFGTLSVIFLYLAFANVTSIDDTKIDIFKIMAVAMSVCWILLGNFLPKCKQNALIGIRTSWTLKSQVVWYKTHRMCGLLLVIVGLISTILCATVLNGYVALLVSLGSLIAIMIPIIIYSYVIYKNEIQKSDKQE